MNLSVIVPVYNQEILVKRALESIPVLCEVIAIDDGSTDNTIKTLLNFQNTRSNVEVLHNPSNLGVSYTINRGLSIASGDYIVLLGSDDYFYTEALERVMREMDGTDLIYFDLLTNEGDVFHLSPDTREIFCGSVKLMRREFIGDTRNKEDIKVGEDWVFFQELLSKNPTEKYTNIVAKHYNFPRDGSLMDLHNKQQL